MYNPEVKVFNIRIKEVGKAIFVVQRKNWLFWKSDKIDTVINPNDPACDAMFKKQPKIFYSVDECEKYIIRDIFRFFNATTWYKFSAVPNKKNKFTVKSDIKLIKLTHKFLN